MSQASEARPITRRRRVLFALLPTLLLLLVVESVARVVCWHRFAPHGTSVRVQGDSRWIADDDVIWTNRPHYLEYDETAQYDAHGIRVAPGTVRLPTKQPNELRVLCLGGSAMAGVGSSQQGDWLKITGISTHPIEDSIDGQLHTLLSAALPGTTVRVLNAAVASHTIAQSHARYRALRALEPDWVISMDGVNEPSALAAGETAWERLEVRWQRHPVNRVTFRTARVLMRNSAFLFLVGEHVFFRTGIIRTARDAGPDPEVLARWSKPSKPPSVSRPALDKQSLEQARAVDAFLGSLTRFHDELTAHGQRHLLLVQPHLSLRDRGRLRDTEQALYHYYMHQHAGRVDGFMQALHARVAADFDGVTAVQSLASLHDAGGWMFLDYCHLTRDANRRIATRAARVILGDSESESF